MKMKRIIVLGILLAVLATCYYFYTLQFYDNDDNLDDDTAFRAAMQTRWEDMRESIQNIQSRRAEVERIQQNLQIRRLPVDKKHDQQNIPFLRFPVDKQQEQQNVPFHRPSVERQKDQQNIPFRRFPMDRRQDQQNIQFRRFPMDRRQGQKDFPFFQPETEDKMLHEGGFRLFPMGTGPRNHRNRREVRKDEDDNNSVHLTLQEYPKSFSTKRTIPSAHSDLGGENVLKDTEIVRKRTEKEQAERINQLTHMLEQVLNQQQMPPQTSYPSPKQTDLLSQQILPLVQHRNPAQYYQQSSYQAMRQAEMLDQQQQNPAQARQQQSQQQSAYSSPQQAGVQQLLQYLLAQGVTQQQLEYLLAQQQNPTQNEQQSLNHVDQNHAQLVSQPLRQHTVTNPNPNEGTNRFQNVEGEINVHFKGTLFRDKNGQMHLSINEIQPEKKRKKDDLLTHRQNAEQGQSLNAILKLAQQLGLLLKLSNASTQTETLKNASDFSTKLLNNNETSAEKLDNEIDRIIGEDPLLEDKLKEIKANLTQDLEQGLEPEVQLKAKTDTFTTTNHPENKSTTEDVRAQMYTTGYEKDQIQTTGHKNDHTQITGDDMDHAQIAGDEKNHPQSAGNEDNTGENGNFETQTKSEAKSSLKVSLYDFSQPLSEAFRCKALPQLPFLICVDSETDPDASKLIERWEKAEARLLQFQSILDTDPSLGALVVSTDAVEFTMAAASKDRQVVAVETDKSKIHPFHQTLLINSVNTSLVTLITNNLVENKDLTMDDTLPLITFANVVVELDVEPRWMVTMLRGASNFFKTVNVKYLLMQWRPSVDRVSHIILHSLLKRYGLRPMNNVKYIDFLHDLGFIVWTQTPPH